VISLREGAEFFGFTPALDYESGSDPHVVQDKEYYTYLQHKNILEKGILCYVAYLYKSIYKALFKRIVLMCYNSA